MLPCMPVVFYLLQAFCCSTVSLQSQQNSVFVWVDSICATSSCWVLLWIWGGPALPQTEWMCRANLCAGQITVTASCAQQLVKHQHSVAAAHWENAALPHWSLNVPSSVILLSRNFIKCCQDCLPLSLKLLWILTESRYWQCCARKSHNPASSMANLAGCDDTSVFYTRSGVRAHEWRTRDLT